MITFVKTAIFRGGAPSPLPPAAAATLTGVEEETLIERASNPIESQLEEQSE
jgi:hypothetical protein